MVSNVSWYYTLVNTDSLEQDNESSRYRYIQSKNVLVQDPLVSMLFKCIYKFI
jgi:hypothetical protein